MVPIVTFLLVMIISYINALFQIIFSQVKFFFFKINRF